MSNKTERSSQLLSQALAALPEAEALREVRYHLKQAMSKMQEVNEKFSKRAKQAGTEQTFHDKWWSDLKAGAARLKEGYHTPQHYDPLRALHNINAMIARKKQELAEMRKPQKPPEIEDDSYLDDDELMMG